MEPQVAVRAFEATSHAMMITDAAGTIRAVNHAFTAATGWTADEAIGRTPRILASGRQDADFYEAMWSALLSEGHWQGELWNRRKSGELYPECLTIDALRAQDGRISHFVAVFSDIDERRAREARLSHLAYHDELTGLPNRTLFLDRLDRTVALARRRGGRIALALVDLDGFKAVNERFGHQAGDLLLKSVAERVKACLRECDTVARFGGDEFAVVLPAVDGAKGAREAAARIRAALARPVYLAGDEIALGASMGLGLFPVDGVAANDLVKAAELALYAVKRRGKGGVAFYGETGFAGPARRRAG